MNNQWKHELKRYSWWWSIAIAIAANGCDGSDVDSGVVDNVGLICNWLLWCFFVWLFVLWQLIVVWCWSLSVSLTFCQLIFVSSWCLFYYCLFIYSLFVWFSVCLKIFFFAWLFSDHGACLFYHDTFVGTPIWRVRDGYDGDLVVCCLD